MEKDILLVEHNDTDAELTLRAMIKVGLEDRVVRVKDGEEALDFVHHRGRFADVAGPVPSLVVLDVKVPKIDGIAILRDIKSNPEARTIPVVMLTSSAQERDRVVSYQVSVHSYVLKPIQ